VAVLGIVVADEELNALAAPPAASTRANTEPEKIPEHLCAHRTPAPRCRAQRAPLIPTRTVDVLHSDKPAGVRLHSPRGRKLPILGPQDK
jgi:hypothetical protein